MKAIQLTRRDLERYFMRDFFDTMVLGFFVRVGVMREQQQVFRASMIVGVDKGMRSYKFGTKQTRKRLVLQYGTVKRDYAMEYVSNSRISEVSG